MKKNDLKNLNNEKRNHTFCTENNRTRFLKVYFYVILILTFSLTVLESKL